MNSKTNELNDGALLVKGALEATLEAQGLKLAEFEAALAEPTLSANAEVLVKGALVKELMGLLQGGGMVGLGTAGLTGAAGAAGIYGAYTGLQDSARKQREAQAVIQRLNVARRELQDSMATPQQ